MVLAANSAQAEASHIAPIREQVQTIHLLSLGTCHVQGTESVCGCQEEIGPCLPSTGVAQGP